MLGGRHFSVWTRAIAKNCAIRFAQSLLTVLLRPVVTLPLAVRTESTEFDAFQAFDDLINRSIIVSQPVANTEYQPLCAKNTG